MGCVGDCWRGLLSGGCSLFLIVGRRSGLVYGFGLIGPRSQPPLVSRPCGGTIGGTDVGGVGFCGCGFGGVGVGA